MLQKAQRQMEKWVNPTRKSTDAELIIALKATADKASIVTRGSIDHTETCAAACGILEGSREAFDRRASIYGIGLG